MKIFFFFTDVTYNESVGNYEKLGTVLTLLVRYLVLSLEVLRYMAFQVKLLIT